MRAITVARGSLQGCVYDEHHHPHVDFLMGQLSKASEVEALRSCGYRHAETPQRVRWPPSSVYHRLDRIYMAGLVIPTEAEGDISALRISQRVPQFDTQALCDADHPSAPGYGSWTATGKNPADSGTAD